MDQKNTVLILAALKLTVYIIVLIVKTSAQKNPSLTGQMYIKVNFYCDKYFSVGFNK